MKKKSKWNLDKNRFKELEYYCYRYSSLAQKQKEIIRKIAYETDNELGEYIFLGVTNKGTTFNNLKTLKEMPCERDTYYDRRRKFYYLLDKKKS